MRKPYTVEMDLHLRCEVNALDDEEAINRAIEELEDCFFTTFSRTDFWNIKVTEGSKDKEE